jgi:predicted MFS family arabinose efflux permease
VSGLFRRLFGAEIDRVLFPVLAVALAGSIASSTMWSFIGIWAKERLGAEDAQLGFTFLISAVLAAVGGYVGGHLSDHMGRRPLIVFGWTVSVGVPLLFIAVGDNLWFGLAVLSVLGFFATIGQAANQALVPDLVPPDRHEAGYAAVRVIQNLGVTMGPPLGGLLLLGENWTRLFVGGAVLSALAWLVAYRFIPARGAYTPEHADRTAGGLRLILRDRLFLLFFVSGCLATLTYITYETVLPISLVDTHAIEPSTWGFLLVINPAMVTLFQMRLTARTTGVPASLKLSAAMLLMGLPFLALIVSGSLLVVAAVIFVFVIGEMFWVPTSQTVIARIAPPERRGAYLGAFGSTFAVGFAVTPFLGLQVRGAFGDAVMWTTFASIAVLAALIGFIACTAAFGVRGSVSEPLVEPA